MALLFLPFFSLLLLSAHFLRHGHLALAIVSLIPILLLPFRHPFIARMIQTTLLCASVVWIRTAYLLTTVRMKVGAPFLTMDLILGGVILLTIVSILLFQTRSLRAYYRFR